MDVIQQALENFAAEEKERPEDVEAAENMIGEMKTLENACLDTEKKIYNNMNDEKALCKEQLNEFEKELRKYYAGMKSMEIYTNFGIGVKNAIERIEEVEEKIEEYNKQLDDFNYYTNMFEMEEGTGEATRRLNSITEEISNMRKLWEHIKLVQETFEGYLKMEWGDLNSDDMEDETKGFQKKLQKMKGVDKKINVYISVNKEIRNWLFFLPLISEMKNPAMMVDDNRHWDAIKDHFQRPNFSVEDDTRLEIFWDLNIYHPAHREEIEEITDRAKQERKIQKNLEMVKEKWETVKFVRVPIEMKEGTIETVKMEDEEIEILEEHQLTVQNIASSKFMGYFEKEVEYWQDGLSSISDTVALLAEVQKTWSFLMNLFIYSEEVKRELRELSENFVQYDKDVKAILENSKSNEIILDFCIQEYEDEKVLTKLEEISKKLGECQKGLNHFISEKRKVFPRFYFLTMEELLDILANGNNPKLLFQEKNYMGKVVQSIERLEMKEEGERPRIQRMITSVGKETVEFINNGIKLEGKVEIYLQDVLKCIKDTHQI